MFRFNNTKLIHRIEFTPTDTNIEMSNGANLAAATCVIVCVQPNAMMPTRVDACFLDIFRDQPGIRRCEPYQQ